MAKEMKNPGIRTLTSFLVTVRDAAPVNFTKLCDAKNSGYGMVSRYIKFCLRYGLILVVREVKGKGRYTSKFYNLTATGFEFLEIFMGIETDMANEASESETVHKEP